MISYSYFFVLKKKIRFFTTFNVYKDEVFILYTWYCEGRKLNCRLVPASRILLMSWISFPRFSMSLSWVQLMSFSSRYAATNSGLEAPHSLKIFLYLSYRSKLGLLQILIWKYLANEIGYPAGYRI